MRKIGVLFILLVTAGFIFYLHYVDKIEKNKIIQAEKLIRSEMVKKYEEYEQTIKDMEKDLNQRLIDQRDGLDEKLKPMGEELIQATKEDYQEINNEIQRFRDQLRPFEAKIDAFDRIATKRNPKETKDLLNKIMIVFERHIDYYRCLIDNAATQEAMEQKIAQAQKDLRRRRGRRAPAKPEEEEEPEVPCSDEYDYYKRAKEELRDYSNELKKKDIKLTG